MGMMRAILSTTLLGTRAALMRAVLLCGALVAVLSGPAVASEQSELLYSRGLVEFHRGKFTEALGLFNQAVQADPSDVYARYYQGVTEGRLGNYQAAVTDLRSVMDIKPELTQGALELGIALVETGDFSGAIRWLEKAQQVPALEADASFYLGIAQLRSDDLAGARTNFQRAMQRNPDLSLSSRYYLGVVEYRAGNYPEAQAHFNSVIETSPDSAVAQEARQFLTKMEEGPTQTLRPYQLFGSLGLAYDSNLQLIPSDNGVDQALGLSTKADGRAEIVAGGWYAPYRSDKVFFSIGYSFYQSLQFQLNSFNLQDHRPQALLTVRAGDATFNMLARYDFYLQQTDSFLSQAMALPWVSYDEGNFGRTEGYYRFRYRDFLKGPYNDFLDGYLDNPGLQQFFYLGRPDRFLTVGYQFGYFQPTPRDGGTTQFGYNANQGNVGAGWAFPFDITGELGYAFTARNYRPTPSAGRVDHENQIAVAIDKYFAEYFVVTLGYLGVINDSNQAQFQYDRNIVSLSVGVRY
jgi:tetratricopeptide (TPR) repeat protein